MSYPHSNREDPVEEGIPASVNRGINKEEYPVTIN